MILTGCGRQPTALRSSKSALEKCLYAPKIQRRRKHEVPLLTHDAAFSREGLLGVLSPDGYQTAWRDYQRFLVDKLNQLTAQTTDENTRTKDLLIKYARDPNHAALFNYASAAHNNHFCFCSVTPKPTPVPSALLSHIDNSFSSLESLRAHFLATADSMFGPGYVWLVKRNQYLKNDKMGLSILATYNAGSPYPGAHFRQQALDMNTANTGVVGDMSPYAYARMMKGELENKPASDDLKPYATGAGTGKPNTAPVYSGSAGSFGAHSKASREMPRRAPGGALVDVLLGISTWEHVWLRDWGVAGKGKFLEAWWDKIDWEVVMERSGYGK
ncbi:MAG: hypothetical protein Q9194_003854 [Teloschistes cf. exilis]